MEEKTQSLDIDIYKDFTKPTRRMYRILYYLNAGYYIKEVISCSIGKFDYLCIRYG